METGTIYMCCYFKQKMEAQAISLIYLPFAHSVNRSLLYVCLLTKKQTEGTVSVCKRTKWPKQTCPSMQSTEMVCT
jgi:hypothetical protein